jgi:hypothetical protein
LRLQGEAAKRSTTVARLVNRLVSYAMEDQLIDAIIDE